jgi:hypothetical protein
VVDAGTIPPSFSAAVLAVHLHSLLVCDSDKPQEGKGHRLRRLVLGAISHSLYFDVPGEFDGQVRIGPIGSA